MKKKKSMIAKIIIYLLIFFVLILTIAFIAKRYLEKEATQDIKSDMLSIQCMYKVYQDNSIVNKTESTPIGEKLSDCNNDIINNFKSKNIIDSNDYDKYYVLSNDDLKTLNTNVENKKDSYYLINYNTGEVIITQGYKGFYTLSDILKLN